MENKILASFCDKFAISETLKERKRGKGREKKEGKEWEKMIAREH